MPLDLLFIHHSCGGQLLADRGERVGGGRDSAERCIYASHPNGGGLRTALEGAGFQVNEASYGSVVGDATDICHWRGKFADHMDRILKTQRQDVPLPEGRTNCVVLFKSCFPNNRFTGRGHDPGDPDSSQLTLANARAAYRALLPLLGARSDVLFVAFTAPPLAERLPQGWKARLKSLVAGRDQSGDLAREFNTWLADRQNGWLADGEPSNVMVFDHYDVLTDHGRTSFAAYPARPGDSHPSSEGNARSTAAFVPLLAAAVAGMGWFDQ